MALTTREARFTSFDGERQAQERICPQPYLQALGRLRDLPTLLAIVADTLGTDLVLLGHVDESTYTVAAAHARRHDLTMSTGTTIPIGETYCREEITRSAPFTLGDAELETPYNTHPGFVKHGLRAYVGAPIHLSDGRLYGTLCGVDSRSRTFSLAQVERLLLLTRYVAGELDLALGVAPRGLRSQA